MNRENKRSGWATVNRVPRSLLALIGWEEYIKSAKRPYPEHLVPRKNKNTDAQTKEKETLK